MKGFYITTAIDYVNSKPHLGHAYEKITADVVARWKRLESRDVFFLTGTDENAQKNAMAAERVGKNTQEFVNEMAENFKKLCKALNISNDYFIRTTEKRHVEIVQKIFQKLYDKGDIYKGEYEGLYCFSCEAFYLEKDLKDGKCPVHKTEPKRIKEESYFFRLSKYQEKLLEFLENNPEFILPKTKRAEILNRVKKGLKDLSVSRFNIDWGIPVPFDEKHKIYVWFDALLNYITALDYPDGEKYKKYWPCDYHFIGVDISWFHCVIWPCMLMALDIPLPKHVFIHGFINIGGEKMSKSRGIFVDPFELVNKYGVDQVRYFLVRNIPFGEDGEFSEESLRERINGELVSDLGNLVNRVLAIVERNPGVKFEGKPELENYLDFEKISQYMDKLELHHALDAIWDFIRATNKYINEKEPWKLKGEELSHVLYNLLESLRVISILISPFMPETSEKINEQLGIEAGTFKDLKFKKFEGNPKKGKILFQKV